MPVRLVGWVAVLVSAWSAGPVRAAVQVVGRSAPTVHVASNRSPGLTQRREAGPSDRQWAPDGQLVGPPAGPTLPSEPDEPPKRVPIVDGPPAPVAPEVVVRDAQGRATIRAIRLAEPLQLDARLDEQVYATVAPVTGFVQVLPDNGQPATEDTDVWVMFDDENVYVTARCWDTGGRSALIANELRRDMVIDDDNFGVLFDTYYDRRNGYFFTINPLGGFRDGYITNEGGGSQY